MNRPELLSNVLRLVVAAAVCTLFWDTVKQPVVFLLTLGILIAIHEWGHFIAARAVGVHAYEFALGFGPKLATYMRRGGTDFTLRLLPLGGFVHLKGMQPDDPITSDGLNGRRAAERALVYLAGPLMNAAFAVLLLLFSAALFGRIDESKVLVGDVTRKLEAARMEVVTVNGRPAPPDHPRGLRIGDRIVEVGGKPVRGLDTVPRYVNPRLGQSVTLTVRRGARTLVLRGTTRKLDRTLRAVVVGHVPAGAGLPLRPGDQIDEIDGKSVFDEGGEPHLVAMRRLRERSGKEVTLSVWRDGRSYLELKGVAGPVTLTWVEAKRTVGILGFAPVPGAGPRTGLDESFRLGLKKLENLGFGLIALFSRPAVFKENVGGPIAIFDLLHGIDRLPAIHYNSFLAQLSLSLCVFNLVPIPILDGGHLLLLTMEVLRRRRLGPEQQKVAAVIGLAIIGAIFILVMSRDLLRHFG